MLYNIIQFIIKIYKKYTNLQINCVSNIKKNLEMKS